MIKKIFIISVLSCLLSSRRVNIGADGANGSDGIPGQDNEINFSTSLSFPGPPVRIRSGNTEVEFSGNKVVIVKGNLEPICSYLPCQGEFCDGSDSCCEMNHPEDIWSCCIDQWGCDCCYWIWGSKC